MASEERFGYEWNTYSQVDPRQEVQFARWVAPLTREDFAGKSVLDAGCGMGRNSYWADTWGAARVVAFDFDERSVAAARKNVPRADVQFRSIHDIDWRDEFDVVFSIGVIHHLRDPRRAIRNLVRALRPAGTLLVWVYSREGNEWLLWWLDPLRTHLTSRLPLPVVHAIAYFFSVPLWIIAKIFRGPGAYLRQLSSFTFFHIHSIVFDQLIPDVANYWTRDEALALFTDLGLVEISIHRPDTKQGWTLVGKKR